MAYTTLQLEVVGSILSIVWREALELLLLIRRVS
jgi:hypothetical protein